MIKPSVVTYEVSNDELGFKVKINNREHAEVIEANLNQTLQFINVLSKYYKLPKYDNHTSIDGSCRSRCGEFIYTPEGLFDGVKISYDYTRVDTWGGRPPIHDRGTNVINAQQFYETELKKVINTIERGIEACKYLSPNRGVTADLPESIFELAKMEITNFESDMKILKNYVGIINVNKNI